MNEIKKNQNIALSVTITEIKDVLEQSRKSVAVKVNQALVATNWKIGEIIIKYEQNEQVRAVYGEKDTSVFI